MHSPRGFLEQICYFLLCYFLISGPVTVSFGFPASKSLWPLKTFKLNLALSNLFYSAARPMHPNWLRITSLFILFHGWFFFCLLLDTHIAREPWNFFYLTSFQRQIFSQFLFLLASLLIFRSNFINTCSPDELFERCE